MTFFALTDTSASVTKHVLMIAIRQPIYYDRPIPKPVKFYLSDLAAAYAQLSGKTTHNNPKLRAVGFYDKVTK